MRITDPNMQRKMERALRDGEDCFTLDDIMHGIEVGTMQSHTFGDTWVITQIHNTPQRKVVDLTFIVGHLNELQEEGLPYLYEWSKSIGANLMTGAGRDGWKIIPGWRRKGSLFSKDLRDG